LHKDDSIENVYGYVAEGAYPSPVAKTEEHSRNGQNEPDKIILS